MPIKKLNPSAPPPDWSKTLDGYFVSFCRKTFRWSPAYRAALKRSFFEKRNGVEYYRCELGKEIISRKEKQVDHIEPVIPVGAPWDRDWNNYRVRCFVGPEKLQVLCKPCHKVKTNAENKGRRALRSKAKRKSVC